MNPHRFTWGWAYDAPLAAIAAGEHASGNAGVNGTSIAVQGPGVTFFFLLVVWITLSWLFGLDRAGDLRAVGQGHQDRLHDLRGARPAAHPAAHHGVQPG
jgi:hypothetical protein